MTQPWNTLKLIRWTTEYFEKKEIPNPRLDAELLLSHVLDWKRIDLYVKHETTISQKNLDAFRAFVERRAKREPLQYILGGTEFWGLKLKVTPDVLIPRPETETLVEEALKVAQGVESPQILDIGTGSGAIAITLAKNLPTAKMIATDISPEALDVARENAAAHGVSDRIEFILSDIAPWKTFEAQAKTFDLIVSNPPYIAVQDIEALQPEVSLHEPRLALDGGKAGFELPEKILKEAGPFLKPGGVLLMEIGEGQAETLRPLITEARRDLQGVERFVVLKK